MIDVQRCAVFISRRFVLLSKRVLPMYFRTVVWCCIDLIYDVFGNASTLLLLILHQIEMLFRPLNAVIIMCQICTFARRCAFAEVLEVASQLHGARHNREHWLKWHVTQHGLFTQVSWLLCTIFDCSLATGEIEKKWACSSCMVCRLDRRCWKDWNVTTAWQPHEFSSHQSDCISLYYLFINLKLFYCCCCIDCLTVQSLYRRNVARNVVCCLVHWLKYKLYVLFFYQNRWTSYVTEKWSSLIVNKRCVCLCTTNLL